METGTLTLVGGDNQNVNLVVTQPNSSAPYNLAGCTLTFTAITSIYFPTPLLTKSATITNAAQGLAQLSFVPSDTTNLAANTYLFNIQLLDTGSNLTTLISGPFTVVSSF